MHPRIHFYTVNSFYCILFIVFLMCNCENVEILIPTGKIFNIFLSIENSNHDLWNLPSCIHLISKSYTTINETGKISITFKGLCFQCDSMNINNELSFNENYTKLLYNNDNDYVMYLNNYHVNTHLLLNINSKNSIQSFHHILLNYNKYLSKKCYKQVPTLLLFIFNVQICNLSYIERIELNKIIKLFMNLINITYLNQSLIISNIEDDNDNVNLILESPTIYERKLSILASAKAHNYIRNSKSNFSQLVSIQHIGCGIIPDYILKILTILEKRFQMGLIPIWTLLNNTNFTRFEKFKHITLAEWIVGDLIHNSLHDAAQTKQNNVKRSLNKRSALSSREAGYLEEGSGMASFQQFPKIDYRSFLEHSSTDLIHSNIPRVKNYITPIKTTVYQISNIQIPQNTFYDLQDGYTQNLKLTLYASNLENISYIELKSMENLNQAIGEEITRDIKKWVSFDTKNQIIRLKPLPDHVGNHTFIVCATDRDQNRVCEPFQIIVKRPSPFRKNFILRIPPGIFWCYQIPIYWFKELKTLSFDKLDLEVKGDSPFSWNVQTGEVCVISNLKISQIITLFFHATNAKLAQSVEIEFRLSAKVPSVQLLVTNSKLRMKFQWPEKLTNYELNTLNKINLTLAEILQNRINPEVSSEKLYVYEIIQFKMPQNESDIASFELDWIFLPLGLPNDGEEIFLLSNDSAITNINSFQMIQNTNLHNVNQPINLYVQSNNIPKLSKLLTDCQLSNLDKAEITLQNNKKLFIPFKLESVKLLNLENSACFLAKKITKQLEEQAYSTSQRSSEIGTNLSRWSDSHLYMPANVQFMPNVLPNFTVIAGLRFKKSINPDNVTPSKRIQYMELRDAYGLILDDSSWISLTLDNSHLIGLPLNEHIRKQPYLFRLYIHSVDQKTPITIGFTVEVQDWFETMKNDKSFQLNHRVRLRILPSIQTSTSQPTEIWPVKPSSSLNYRWKLSNAIDKFLHPNCSPPCNPDVGIWQITQQNVNSLSVTWAQLSLLQEQGKSQTGISDGNTPNCPWEKFDHLQNLLIFAPTLVSAQKNLGLVTGLANDGQLYLSPWSAPSNHFRAHMESSELGIVEAAVVDRMGSCARHTNKFEGQELTGKSMQNRFSSFSSLDNDVIMNFTVFTGEGFRRKIVNDDILATMSRSNVHLYDIGGRQVGSSHWIGLEKDKSTIFGIIIGNSVQPSSHKFHITDNPEKNVGVQFSIYVAGSNPQLPINFNHRVVMHFSADHSRPWTGGHSLVDRWLLISALDDYLRPHCMGSMICRNDMDIILLTLNYQASGFSVIWAQKSILILTENINLNKTTEILDSYTQQEYWSQWSKNIHHTVKRSIDLNQISLQCNSQYENCQSSTSTIRFTKPINQQYKDEYRRKRNLLNTINCPEREIIKLENRLLSEIRKDLQQPSIDFIKHLKETGVGQLDEIQIERLGPCIQTHKAPPIFIPGPGFEGNHEMFIPNYENKREYKESVDSGPSGSSSSPSLSSLSTSSIQDEMNGSRVILLGTLLPICISLIILLLGILAFVWYRKNGKSCPNGLTSHTSIVNSGHSVVNLETEKMLTTITSPKKLTSNGRQSKNTKPDNMNSGSISTGSDKTCLSPTKPMILTNERPPFTPPDYNPGFTDSTDRLPMTHLSQSQIPLQNTNETLVTGMMDIRQNQTKTSFTLRPNPYRNLPPAIETKPGMPPPASQIPYAPFRKIMTFPNSSIDHKQ
uniref:Ig-like domain-containing protein n=2 Tax=Schistosoma mansoni TaxID=6183 RepID=A0A5K4F164_SCHMA